MIWFIAPRVLYNINSHPCAWLAFPLPDLFSSPPYLSLCLYACLCLCLFLSLTFFQNIQTDTNTHTATHVHAPLP